jgi:ribosomal protein L11 methylase PrmA
MEERLCLFRGSPDAVNGSFQLVLANLPAAVHMELFDHYRRLAHPQDGLLVVSGFSDVNSARIENEIVGRGFMVLERVIVDAWAAATTPEYSFTWVGLGLKRIENDTKILM